MTKKTKSEPVEVSKTIAGHRMLLESGKRYRAERPMAASRQERFNVTIRDMDGNVAHEVYSLSYDRANELLSEFNNGPTSWDGRVWP